MCTRAPALRSAPGAAAALEAHLPHCCSLSRRLLLLHVLEEAPHEVWPPLGMAELPLLAPLLELLLSAVSAVLSGGGHGPWLRFRSSAKGDDERT